MLTWIDKPTCSIRSDGAKVAQFVIDGEYVWWAYPADWRPRGNVDAIGPFLTVQEGKDALTSQLIPIGG